MSLQVSVVIPTCQRLEMLSSCLQRLAPGVQGVQPSLYEVIVTDDGGAVSACNMIAERFPWVRWTEGPRRGPAANRNHGARQAAGVWLAFLDDDCLPDSGWLSAIVSVGQGQQVDVIEGKTIAPDKSDNPLLHVVENNGGNLWSCNLTIRAAVFSRLGGFDEDFRDPAFEDMELANRIGRDGFVVQFVPEAVVVHPSRIVNWRSIFWRARYERSYLLYQHKIGQLVPVDEHVWKALASVARLSIIDVVKSLSSAPRRGKTSGWLSVTCRCLLRVLSLPVALPYAMILEISIRKQLSGKA